MKIVIERALDTASAGGAAYADARIVRKISEFLMVKDGQVAAVNLSSDYGLGVRALVNGSWGFASASTVNTESADEVAGRALRIARASARVQAKPVVLAPQQPSVGEYVSPFDSDPFDVSTVDKLGLLLRVNELLRREKGVTVAECAMEIYKTEKAFGSTDGAYVTQTIVESGAGMESTATSADDIQKRSFPNSFGRQVVTGGYEEIEKLALESNAPKIASESVALLSAAECPATTTTVILDATQVALQVHESCGHPTELDRALGYEASFAGTSFLTPDMLGAFRYGSDTVNIVADATAPLGAGTFGYDDEGVPAQRNFLIKDGIFVGYLTSRETASELDQGSSGAMRAESWNHIPLIRMTNINLMPGETSLEDLIASTDDGIYMELNKSWSIDDLRLNFQFGTEVAWQIEGGRLTTMYKNPTYTGITPRFWQSCDAVADNWRMWGTPNCGKGEPVQGMHVGHGAAAARFRDVRVGVRG